MSKQDIIVVRESPMESLVSDAGTLVMFFAMIGLGVWLESAAMQWTGAVVFFIGIIGMAEVRLTSMTIDQARAKLDEIEARK